MVIIRIEIPDTLAIRTIKDIDLPSGWDDPVPSTLTKDIGTEWVRSCATAVLSVPSAIIPGERNYLLNPMVPAFLSILFSYPEPFRFDPRLK
jgi:RES domain-containing protein